MVSSDSAPTKPLDGVRVLSFGSYVAGNLCALMLGELGADVVKIELKDRPEALRAYDSPDMAEVFEPSGIRTTALFAGMARSVRSISIDMKSVAGQHTFRKLVGKANVVFENLGPGTMESWGCSFPELKTHNPSLAMISISGYGKTGPLRSFRAYASNICNYLGLTEAWVLDGIHFDFVAAVHGASAVVAALAAVDRGAAGVFIDMAQTEAGAAVMAPLYLDYLANEREWSAEHNEVPGSLLSNVVKCRGTDEWVAVELEDMSDWHALCAYLDRDDLIVEAVTSEHRRELSDALAEWASTLTPFQAAHALQNVGLAVGPVQNSEDLWRDAQLRSRGAFVEVSHPDIGLVEYPSAPNRLSATPGRIKCRCPRLGEHTVTILHEWLKCEEAEIDELRRSGAVWQLEG